MSVCGDGATTCSVVYTRLVVHSVCTGSYIFRCYNPSRLYSYIIITYIPVVSEQFACTKLLSELSPMLLLFPQPFVAPTMALCDCCCSPELLHHCLDPYVFRDPL